MRCCYKCHIEKNINEFHRDTANARERRYICKECVKVYKAHINKRDKKKNSIKKKIIYQLHKEENKLKAKNRRDSLDDSYVKKIIKQQSSLKLSEIPIELIELKRKQIQVIRILKQKTL